MANKPRMGSDPFQKKDPLGWIGGEQPLKTAEVGGVPNPPGNPGKLSKSSKPSTQNQPGKGSKPSKHELLSLPSTPERPGAPSEPSRGTTTSKGLRPGWTRATFIVREETVQQLKAVAYWDRKEIKRVVEEAFRSYLEGKMIKAIPQDSAPLD